MGTAPENFTFLMHDGWIRYRALLRECCHNPKRRGVHDLRTQLRKLVALLGLFEEFTGKRETENIRKSLKKQIACLKELRDFQVQEKTVKSQIHRTGSVYDFFRYLKKSRKSEEKKMKKRLRRISLKKAELKILKSEECSGKVGVQKLKQLVNESYRDALDCSNRANVSDPASLHRFRIQFRKYRHTREVLKPLIPIPKSAETEMKKLQDLLGNIQDATVLIQNLYHFLITRGEEHPPSDFLAFLRSFEKEQENLIDEFFKNRSRFLSAVAPIFLSEGS